MKIESHNKVNTKRVKHWLGMLFALMCINQAYAETISVAAGWARPPYINATDHSGFELEIVRQVLFRMGHKTKVVYVPHHTTITMLKVGQVDMALTLNKDSGVDAKFLSDSYITYQNVILSLKRHNLSLSHIQELSSLRVLGFQSAKDVLGVEYKRAVSDSNLYFEMADQKKQIELFLQGNVDVIAIDINVFEYLSTEIMGGSQFEKVTVHPFFPYNDYHAGFKDMALKDSFNTALKDYLLSTEYQHLKAQYQIKHIAPVNR